MKRQKTNNNEKNTFSNGMSDDEFSKYIENISEEKTYFKKENEPYKVFSTKEEFEEAIDDIVTEKLKTAINKISQNEMNKPKTKEDIINSILKAEQEIKKHVPDFDFKTLMRENEEFRNRILKGYPIDEAFYIINRKNSNSENQPKTIGIKENGISSKRSGASKKDIKSMSEREFKSYIQKLMGSKI